MCLAIQKFTEKFVFFMTYTAGLQSAKSNNLRKSAVQIRFFSCHSLFLCFNRIHYLKKTLDSHNLP